ncbi:MAG: hypothetical protein AB7I42_24210 [Bradyrhizobium sp.]|uniref:hypothetical protein n=1 Tax=Bradyrhizobium sp. TaxID=376 RepID=UPI003D146D8F
MAEGVDTPTIDAPESKAVTSGAREVEAGGGQKDISRSVDPGTQTEFGKARKAAVSQIAKFRAQRLQRDSRHGEVDHVRSAVPPDGEAEGDAVEGASDEAPEAGEKPPAKGPLGHLNPDLVEWARDLGFEDDFISGHNDKLLLKAIKREERLSAAEPAPKEEPKPQAKEPEKPKREKYVPKFADDEVTEGFKSEVTRLADHLNSALDEIDSLKAERETERAEKARTAAEAETRETMTTIVSFIRENPRLSETLGSGIPEEMTPAQRKAVHEILVEADTHRRGYQMTRGKSVPSMGELFKQHAKLKYGDKLSRKPVTEAAKERMRERAEEAIDLSGAGGRANGKAGGEGGNRAEGIRAVYQWRLKHGMK